MISAAVWTTGSIYGGSHQTSRSSLVEIHEFDVADLEPLTEG